MEDCFTKKSLPFKDVVLLFWKEGKLACFEINLASWSNKQCVHFQTTTDVEQESKLGLLITKQY